MELAPLEAMRRCPSPSSQPTSKAPSLRRPSGWSSSQKCPDQARERALKPFQSSALLFPCLLLHSLLPYPPFSCSFCCCSCCCCYWTCCCCCCWCCSCCCRWCCSCCCCRCAAVAALLPLLRLPSTSAHPTLTARIWPCTLGHVSVSFFPHPSPSSWSQKVKCRFCFSPHMWLIRRMNITPKQSPRPLFFNRAKKSNQCTWNIWGWTLFGTNRNLPWGQTGPVPGANRDQPIIIFRPHGLTEYQEAPLSFAICLSK